MQGGINPDMAPFTYRDILVEIKQRFPALHVHAFSPMEIMYGARRTNMDYPAYIGMLRDRGRDPGRRGAGDPLAQEGRRPHLGRHHHDGAPPRGADDVYRDVRSRRDGG